MLRVFMDSSRLTRPIPERTGSFQNGDPRIYRDHDNPRATYAMADIPPQNLFAGTHTAVILPYPDAPRTTAGLAAIASHDDEFHSASNAVLLDLLRIAIDERLVSDGAPSDKD